MLCDPRYTSGTIATSESFGLALIRFSNVMSLPEVLYSDNARSFVNGCQIFNKFFDSAEYHDRFGCSGIKHILSPSLSPHYGGVWERCLRTIKSCIKKEVGRNQVEYLHFLTIISDVQLAVNSRPLSYQSRDINDDLIAPIDFLNPLAKRSIFIRNDQPLIPLISQ